MSSYLLRAILAQIRERERQRNRERDRDREERDRDREERDRERQRDETERECFIRWKLSNGGHYTVGHPSARVDLPEDHLCQGRACPFTICENSM